MPFLNDPPPWFFGSNRCYWLHLFFETPPSRFLCKSTCIHSEVMLLLPPDTHEVYFSLPPVPPHQYCCHLLSPDGCKWLLTEFPAAPTTSFQPLLNGSGGNRLKHTDHASSQQNIHQWLPVREEAHLSHHSLQGARSLPLSNLLSQSATRASDVPQRDSGPPQPFLQSRTLFPCSSHNRLLCLSALSWNLWPWIAEAPPPRLCTPALHSLPFPVLTVIYHYYLYWHLCLLVKCKYLEKRNRYLFG